MKKIVLLLILSFGALNLYSQNDQTEYYFLFNDSIQIPACTDCTGIVDTMESSLLKTVTNVKIVEQLSGQKENIYLPISGDVWVLGVAGNSYVDSTGTILTKPWGFDTSYVHNIWKQLHPKKRGTISVSFIDNNGVKRSVGANIYAT